jgi:hypothetical protein
MAISGTCIGEVAFDQLDGTALGATLIAVEDNLVVALGVGASETFATVMSGICLLLSACRGEKSAQA